MCTLSKKICQILILGLLCSSFMHSLENLSIKAGTTDIHLYGFIKLDALWTNRITNSFEEVTPQNVPLYTDPADHHNQFILDARNSRFGISATNEFFDIKTKGVIEGDFFSFLGDALVFNSRAFRLRLAYAKATHPSGFFLLIGQFWTLPMGIPDIPAPLYVNTQFAPVGVAYARQPQCRIGYVRNVQGCGDLKIEFDIEKHAFNNLGYITPAGGDPAQGGEQRLPLFVGKLSWLGDNFKCSLAGVASRANVILNLAGDQRKHDIWAMCGIASYKWKKMTLWATINRSVGLSSVFEGWFDNMALTTFNELLPFRSSGGCIALRWDWIEDVLISNTMWGIQHGDRIENSVLTNNRLKSLKDFRVNLFYNFWTNWQIAVQYQSIMVQAFNDKTGHVNAVHMGIWYNFGKP